MNTEHGPRGAVSGIAGTAQFAITTAGIYLTDNTTTGERSITTVFNDANKLMPNRSIETSIPTRDFKIRITDSRQQHAHECFINTIRLFDIFNCETFLIDAEGKHSFCAFCAFLWLKSLTSRVRVLWREFDHLLSSSDSDRQTPFELFVAGKRRV